MSIQTITEVHVLLDDQTLVREDFYESIRQQVESVMPAVTRGVKYTVKNLLGKEFWASMDNRDRRLAGKCMVNMVKTGIVDFYICGCDHEFPRKYMLR